MVTSFQFVALPYEQFETLFEQSDSELVTHSMRRMIVNEKPGFPCRVSLADAEIGETVLLLPFMHHKVSTPYQSSGPIFVRKGRGTATPKANEIPLMFRHRLLSIRGYNAKGMMVSAEVVDGSTLEDSIHHLFENEKISYLHIHNASPGCYNCCVIRA